MTVDLKKSLPARHVAGGNAFRPLGRFGFARKYILNQITFRGGEMGGMHGYVRGRTKIECYLNFRRTVNQKQIEEATGLYMDAGTGTKA